MGTYANTCEAFFQLSSFTCFSSDADNFKVYLQKTEMFLRNVRSATWVG